VQCYHENIDVAQVVMAAAIVNHFKLIFYLTKVVMAVDARSNNQQR